MKAGGVGGGEQRPSERHGTDVGEVRTSLRGRLRETQTGDPRAAPPCAHRRRVPMDGPRRGGPAHTLACALLAPHSAPQEGSAPAHPMSRNTHRELLLGVRCGPATTNPPPPPLPQLHTLHTIRGREGGRQRGRGTGPGPAVGRGRSRPSEGNRERAGGKRRSPLQGTAWKCPSPQSGTRGGGHKGARIGVPPRAAPRRRPHGTGESTEPGLGVCPGTELTAPVWRPARRSVGWNCGAPPILWVPPLRPGRPGLPAARVLCVCRGVCVCVCVYRGVRTHTRGT